MLRRRTYHVRYWTKDRSVRTVTLTLEAGQKLGPELRKRYPDFGYVIAWDRIEPGPLDSLTVPE